METSIFYERPCNAASTNERYGIGSAWQHEATNAPQYAAAKIAHDDAKCAQHVVAAKGHYLAAATAKFTNAPYAARHGFTTNAFAEAAWAQCSKNKRTRCPRRTAHDVKWGRFLDASDVAACKRHFREK